MGQGFLSEVVKRFWNYIAVIVVQLCESATQH